jgi:type II secretory pathway component GspD/PulD (secretin)
MQINAWLYLPSRWMPALVLAGILSIGVMSQPCEGDDRKVRFASLSLNLNEEPLGEVLKKISNDTGYKIMIDPVWTGVPVSASFKSLPIDQALQRILSKLNHSLIFNEAENRIVIDIISFHDGESFQRRYMPRTSDEDLPGSWPSSALDLRDIINPADVQVIPPNEPNGAGVTLKELQEIEAQQVKTSSDDIEVIPPP